MLGVSKITSFPLEFKYIPETMKVPKTFIHNSHVFQQ